MRKRARKLAARTLLAFVTGALLFSGPPGIAQAQQDRAGELVERVAAALRVAVIAKHPQREPEITISAPPAAILARECGDMSIKPQGSRLHGRLSVLVRCGGPQAWSVYVAADVAIDAPVVVSTRALSRGQPLTRDVLTTRLVPLRSLRDHHVTDIESVLGHVAKRSLAADKPLSINHLEIPKAVRRGDRVLVEYASDQVRIQTWGIAMADGRVGDQITVKNERSARIVRPWVLSQGRVGMRPPVP